MKWALIENNEISNIIVADEDFARSIGAIEVPEDACIGWQKIGTGFEPKPEPPQPVRTPDFVSSRQFKLMLEIMGQTLAVETWVAAQPKLIRIAYENSGQFDRNDPMLQAGFKALGFSEADLTAFYVAAAKL